MSTSNSKSTSNLLVTNITDPYSAPFIPDYSLNPFYVTVHSGVNSRYIQIPATDTEWSNTDQSRWIRWSILMFAL